MRCDQNLRVLWFRELARISESTFVFNDGFEQIYHVSVFCESPIVLHGLVQSEILDDPSETT